MRRAGSATVLDTRFRFVQFSQRNAVVAEADPGDHAVHQPGYGRTDRRTDVVLSDLASSGACARHGCCLRRCVALMLLFVFMYAWSEWFELCKANPLKCDVLFGRAGTAWSPTSRGWRWS